MSSLLIFYHFREAETVHKISINIEGNVKGGEKMNNKEPDMSRAISLIDSHIHLDDPRLISGYPEHLNDARALGITAWILPSTTAASFSDVLAIAAADTSVYPALGLHPYFMEDRKRTRLNSSHVSISYAVSRLKK